MGPWTGGACGSMEDRAGGVDNGHGSASPA
jgi:hypothetical protein